MTAMKVMSVLLGKVIMTAKAELNCLVRQAIAIE